MYICMSVQQNLSSNGVGYRWDKKKKKTIVGARNPIGGLPIPSYR
jgi:hypothetical protein